jgi:hypothetical protein
MQRIFIDRISCLRGNYLSRKAVHSWVEKFPLGRSKVADDETEVAEVAQTTLKRFLSCGFRRTGKAMGQVYQCWWRICREINVFFFSGWNKLSSSHLDPNVLLILRVRDQVKNLNLLHP